MEPDTGVTSSRIYDPYWTAADYVRFADHGSADVRLWALARLNELDLEIPADTLRRRLEDADLAVALTAARLAAQRGTTSLADALLNRLKRAEDAVGAACAQSLAELGDHRLVEVIRRRNHLAPENREPGIWQALCALKSPEATDLIRHAFDRIPPEGTAPTASILSKALMLADPAAGVPLVVERWVGQTNEVEADALLDSLLLLAEFPDGAAGLREAMEPDRKAWLPGDILDDLGDMLPLATTHHARKACRKRHWAGAIEAITALADGLTTRIPEGAGAVPALTLLRALGTQGTQLNEASEKAQDAVGLMLLALDQIAQEVRESRLSLPGALEDQLRWLLSDAAIPYQAGQADVLSRLADEAPPHTWIAACVRTVERRAPQSPAAAGLLEAWRSEAAIPVLVNALGDREDDALGAAAVDSLVAIGDSALEAVLERMASAEDPILLDNCLNVCGRLPSRRAVAAICRRFEDLFVLAPEALLSAIRDLGAREFLEPLGRELREGEVQAEETFALLCDLYAIKDPRLPAIRQREAERLRRMDKISRDPLGARLDHLNLALRCNGCRRTYTYPVRAVYLDPDLREGESLQPFIKDRIRCKGCGREDDYTLAPMAHFAILTELTLLTARTENEGEEAARLGPLYLMKLGLADGRRMNPREARRDYEARLAKRPDDAGLHIGYGNILRFLEEIEAAEAAYRRALELEPRAAEAHASLGQLAEERGDLTTAQSMYQQCAALGWRARFYHVQDRRDFNRKMEEALEGVQGALAARPPDPAPAKDRLDALLMDDRTGLKVGRNDPCPCGSGRKYKKCCLLKDSPPPGERRPRAADERLRERLVAYVGRDLPRADFHRAMREFFGERFDPKTTALALDPEEHTTEWPAFLEWLIHDFRLSTGPTPMATFLADRGHSLPADERAILEEWQDTAVGLHEVVDLDPGKSLTLRDVFTGETFRVREVRGSLSAARWDLFSSRLVRIQGEPFIAGVCTVFRQSDREDLVRHVTERFQTYQREHPGASWRAFFRAQPLIFHRYAEKLAREYVPPKVHTAEGHPVMLGRLRYAIRDDKRLLAALSAAPDFEETTQADDPPNTRQFAWLRTGPAERFVREVPCPDDGLMLTNQRLDASGRVEIPGLATLTATRGELTVEAMSAERLAWVKGRLAELAGDLLQLRADVVEDPWRKVPAVGSSRGDAQASAVPPEIERRLVGQMMHRHLTAWVDQAIPALDGRTPRDAARDPSLRPKVVQLLREIENYQDRARQQGKVWYDIAWLWEELGISRREA